VDAAPIKLDVFSPQRLTERARLHRITLVITLGGAIVGSFLGGTTSVAVYPDAGPAAISLGAISAAVLGAFAGFAVSSFASVAHQALREALGDPTVHRRVQHGRH